MAIDIPKVWDILKRFKNWCEAEGWRTSESEDWVRKGDVYHNFLWTPTVHLSTFKKIAMNRKCAINEGVSYRVVDVSYTAWLFPQPPPKNLLQLVVENPELLRRNAIYDLSWLYTGKPMCLKLNKTKSAVFREFERFLQEKWGVEIKSCKEILVEEA